MHIKRKVRKDSRININGKLIAPPPPDGPAVHNANTKYNWGCECSYCTLAIHTKWWNSKYPDNKREIMEKDGLELWEELEEVMV